MTEMWPFELALRGDVMGSLSTDERGRVVATARWCQEYLLRGHSRLGRSGPVCPWCPPAVARGHLYLTHARVRLGDEAAVVADLHRLRGEYERTPPTSGSDLTFKAVLCVLSFTDTEPTGDALRDWMLRIHRTAKPSFLNRGLMLGEFFPGHAATGLRSESFMPLRSPVPLFVLRAMVPLDIAFLAERRDYAAAYFARFAEQSAAHLKDIFGIAPKRLARDRLRALLRCASWYDLHRASAGGRDIVTGGLLKHAAVPKLQAVLDRDRTFRPLVTALVLQPRDLGDQVVPGSLPHLEWLWATAHRWRAAAGPEEFLFRDGDRLVAVLARPLPTDVQRVVEQVEASGDDVPPSLVGRATEGVADSYAAEWQWDGTEHTLAATLLDSAYADLRRRYALEGRAAPMLEPLLT